MKIVIATAVYHPQINGVAVFAYNLARGLVKRGHEVMVICPSQTGNSYVRTVDGVRTAYLRSVDVKVYPDQIHAVPKKRRLWYRHGFRVSAFPQLEIKKLLNEFKPDVVHVQVSDPIGLSVVGWARRARVPVVTTEHNQPEVITDPLKMPKLMKKPANALLSAYFRNRQSKSDFVTMPTEKAIRGLLARGEEFPVPVAAVSNGVDLSCFKPGKAEAKLYKKFELEAQKKTVLYVGRVDPEKNVGAVIEAFIEANIQESQLLIVGDGVDKVRLEKMVADRENIKFAGRIVPPELYQVYQLGDVFATASPIETQGIVLIEAAASGLPLIAVDKGAVSEVCVDGENGYLCEPGAVNEIAEAMTKILTDEKLREKFAKKSVEIAGAHDFEKTLDQFVNIYNRVIKQQHSES